MIVEIAIILLSALIASFLFKRIHLPGLLGMICVGVILGPSVFDFIGKDTSVFLKEFKTVALIVILIRAGLGINRETLHKIGGPAIKMSVIPAILEGTIATVAIHFILDLTIVESGMLGFILAAVSPAVVIPTMLDFKEKGLGKNKEIPTLILAGASVDDVFAITIFSIFVGLASGNSANWLYLILGVPGGIISALLLGLFIGIFLVWLFKKYHMRDTLKMILFVVAAIILYYFAEIPQIKNLIPIASLLGIMTIGFVILEKYDVLANRLAQKFNQFWVIMEIILFVYIGSQVQLQELSSQIIGVGLLIIFIGLSARSIGVLISLAKSNLNTKEKLFCVLAYLPKATVQAAIGAVPLTMIMADKMPGITEETGRTILAIAVLSIVVTAPIGAIGTKIGGPKLLKSSNSNKN